MRIGLDIDGTLTDFEKFILDNSSKYMKNKHDLDIININGYDVDEVFDIENELIKRGCYNELASRKNKEILSDFWKKYYLKYCIFTPFRNGAKETIKKLYNEGHEIYIFSSRKNTCDNSLLGKFVRNTTKLQLLINGIIFHKLFLFPNDEEKIAAIRNNNINLMIDDKPKLIEEVSKFTNVFCINTNYNQNCSIRPEVHRINDFIDGNILQIINKTLNK
ncbi:hypothetical protein LPY66_19215 [Dehalobacter sp. DCM]|uniref:hypothetical protein n=1 Tax=Dehalobacter sp. DCM TaxID=2907827 RepID=UPI003081CE2B|nr:hypothetical protein LPY66_19215 [Dehalobacter sp. DCM]